MTVPNVALKPFIFVMMFVMMSENNFHIFIHFHKNTIAIRICQGAGLSKSRLLDSLIQGIFMR